MVSPTLRCCLSFAVFLLLSLSPVAAQSPECKDPHYLDHRDAVIEPCTHELARPDLAPSERVRFLEYRARGLRALKRDDEALRDIEAGLTLRPDDAALLFTRAGIERDRDELERAWNDGLRAVELAPDKPLYYQILINIALQVGNSEAARELTEHAWSLDPGNVGLIVSRYYYHRNRGELSEALAAIDEALASPRAQERKAFGANWNGRGLDGDTALRLQRAEIFQQRMDGAAAGQAYEALVAERRDVITLTERANFKLNKQDDRFRTNLHDALGDIDAAIALDPKYDHAHYVRSRILWYMNRDEDALSAIDEAIRLTPDSHLHHAARTRVYKRLGRYRDAEEDLKTMIALHPLSLATLIVELRKHSYFLEDQMPASTTPAVLDGIKACVRDERCW